MSTWMDSGRALKCGKFWDPIVGVVSLLADNDTVAALTGFEGYHSGVMVVSRVKYRMPVLLSLSSFWLHAHCSGNKA